MGISSTRRASIGVLIVLLVIPWSAAASKHKATYTAAGTVVVKQPTSKPVVDEGAVLCMKASASGIGGGCLRFGSGNSIKVTDNAAGLNVAFQVCIDNNGDGLCRATAGAGSCADQIFFNHDDLNVFHNPLGPLPTGFKPGCPGGAWKGYVVFLCDGVHQPKLPSGLAPAHAHTATRGTIQATTGGTGFGNFCDAPPPRVYRTV